ncbi:hypothetical protein RF11_11780 [Thelohanellus kitauei]|uniref:Uncharacterized protein n=1 Tax=Thelohanellus kitauei TaxID=669202 RepID=A0A0C2M8Q4_THEKT|nr:hypothetical protein RF11_11780 [Thelohanellus kitauei]
MNIRIAERRRSFTYVFKINKAFHNLALLISLILGIYHTPPPWDFHMYYALPWITFLMIVFCVLHFYVCLFSTTVDWIYLLYSNLYFMQSVYTLGFIIYLVLSIYSLKEAIRISYVFAYQVLIFVNTTLFGFVAFRYNKIFHYRKMLKSKNVNVDPVELNLL